MPWSAISRTVKLLNKGDDMSEYYAVQRSGEHLAHYGVKGMKWGVRKAIASGNSKSLARAYKKATKKLNKLNRNANVGVQKVVAQVQKRKALTTGLGAAGLSGLSYLSGKTIKPHVVSGTTKVFTVDSKTGKTILKSIPTNAVVNEGSKTAHVVSGALTGLAIGKTAYHAGKALAAKRRTTEKGHTKAVAKRDAWRKEMQNAFKGTKYASLPEVKSNRQGKKRSKRS